MREDWCNALRVLLIYTPELQGNVLHFHLAKRWNMFHWAKTSLLLIFLPQVDLDIPSVKLAESQWEVPKETVTFLDVISWSHAFVCACVYICIYIVTHTLSSNTSFCLHPSFAIRRFSIGLGTVACLAFSSRFRANRHIRQPAAEEGEKLLTTTCLSMLYTVWLSLPPHTAPLITAVLVASTSKYLCL